MLLSWLRKANRRPRRRPNRPARPRLRPSIERLERRELLSGTPTLLSPGIVQVGLGTYTTNFPDHQSYAQYLSPAAEDYHPPSTVFLSGTGISPSPVFPHVTAASPYLRNPDPAQNKPVTTSEWWSSLLFRRDIEQATPFHVMQPQPLSLLARPDGLGLAYVDQPTIQDVPAGDPRGPGTQFFQYRYPQTAPGSGVFQDDLKVGLAALTNTDPDQVTVYNYSDWTVTADWAGQMRATAGEGLPFVYFEFPQGGSAQITFPGQATLVQNFKNGSLLVKVGDHYYGLFGPTAAAANWDTSDPGKFLLNNLTAQTGYLSVAVLPDGFTPADTATFELFRSHAYNFVTDARATFTFDPATGKVVTTYQLTTQFRDNPADKTLNQTDALQALYVTQWLYLTQGTADPARTYTSARGPMKLLAGDQFRTTLQYQGTLPFLPDIPGGSGDPYHQDLWNKELLPYLRLRSTKGQPDDRLDLSNLIRGGDVYSLGQSMLGAAQLVPLLDQVSQDLQASPDPKVQAQGRLAGAYAQEILVTVKDQMGAWLSATDDNKVQFLYYDQNFNALLAVPGAYFSSDSINDQHLGFGYYIQTAALIAQYDPAWAAPSQMGGMIDLIIKEVANDALDTRGQLLPRLRNFDPYAGHSWADGAANSNNGNNQESSSEALNFATGLIHWGEVTGDASLRDLGVYLFTTESTSVNYYYFNQANPKNPAAHAGVTRPAISIVESVGGEYQTFFDLTPAVIQSIQFVPFTGGSYYLAGLGDFLDASGKPAGDPAFTETNFQAGKGQPGSNPQNVYQNPLYMYRALEGQAQADSSLAYLFDPATGKPNYLPFDAAPGTPYSSNNGVDNPGFDFHWLSVLKAYGRPDRAVTADTTSYAVYAADDGSTKTYVAYNPTAAPLKVTFSDGFVLSVPAFSLKSSAGGGLVTGTPDYSLHTLPSRLFLTSGDLGQPTQGTLTVGTTGAFESNLAIPPANNGVTKDGLQARVPPNAPAATFTLTGVTGTFDKTRDVKNPFDFRIWLDGGVIPASVHNSQVGLLVEIFNGGSSTPDYFVRYSEYALPVSSATGVITGYLNPYTQDVAGGIVDYTGKSAGHPIPTPPDLKNATIRVTLYDSLGLTPVNVRVNAATEQGRVSYLDIPYTVTASTPTVAVAADSDTSPAGGPVTLTATVTAAGATLPAGGQVQFYSGTTPVGGLVSLGKPQTVGGITTATATLAGFTGLPVGASPITAKYFSPPAISGLSATSGGAGQLLRISGMNLGQATAVTIGGTPVQAFTVDSPTQITATVGARASGPVQVTTPLGVATSATPFTYLAAAAPSLTDYTPPSAGKGGALKLTGAHFTGATGVTVGGTAVQSFHFVSDNQIKANLGNGSSGPIEVTTPGGTASSAYLADPSKRVFLFGGNGPTIFGLSALSGGPDQVLVISGQQFNGATAVTIGGKPVQSFTVADNDISITATVGDVATGPVQVTTPAGTALSYQIFAFAAADTFLVTSPPLAHAVNAAGRPAPAVTVASTYPRIPYASTTSTLTFTATVTGTGGALPTDSVTFRVNGNALATVAVGPDGTASYTPAMPLLPGPYALTAEYHGDTAYAPATSAPVQQVVTWLNPQVVFVDAGANPAIGGAGNLVILRAKLQSQYPSGGYAPGGTLAFYDGSTLLGPGTSTFDPGVFTFATVFTRDPANATTHNIRVEYRGDSYYYPSTFPACGYPLTVEPATQTQGLATTTTVSAMVNAPGMPVTAAGQTVFFNASVAVSNPPPGFSGLISGKVTLYYQKPGETGDTWHPMDVNPSFLLLYYNGRPNLDQTNLLNLPSFVPEAAGVYTVKAVFEPQIDFNGDPNNQYLGSTSGLFTLDVQASPGLYPTAITVSQSQSDVAPRDTTVLDEAVTFTAAITSPNSWGTGPFGTQVTGKKGTIGQVQFYKDGAPFGGLVPVFPNGQALLTVQGLVPGQTKWTAQFLHNAGTTVFGDSPLSSPVVHTVISSDPSQLKVVLTPSANPSAGGGPVSFAVTVTGQSAGNVGVPGGSVQVQILQGGKDTGLGGTVVLDGTGRAVFTTSALQPGQYTVQAVYNADAGDPYFPTGQPQNTSRPVTQYVTAAGLALGAPPGPAPAPGPDEAFVEGLYQSVLGRPADAAGLQAWQAALAAGMPRAEVARRFWQSPEHRGLEVDQFYAAYLHRAADPVGRAVWVGALLSGLGEAGVAAALLASPEYQAGHAGAAAFVTALYADVLGRAPDAAGLAGWVGAATSGQSRQAIATAFLRSAEAGGRLLDGYYADFLGRPADPAGRAFYLEGLLSGHLTWETVAEVFLASDEFANRAG
jgi:endoglucanase Acf2